MRKTLPVTRTTQISPLQLRSRIQAAGYCSKEATHGTSPSPIQDTPTTSQSIRVQWHGVSLPLACLRASLRLRSADWEEEVQIPPVNPLSPPRLIRTHNRSGPPPAHPLGLAHRFLHERSDSCLFGASQPLQREGIRPHGAFVEVRLVAKAERRIPRFELPRWLEEADDLAVLGIRGHPVPESRREGWRAGFDDSMEPFAHGAIRFPHLGDLREHGAFPVRLVRARVAARGRLQLLGALLHRGSFLVRESLERLADRAGALGGLLRGLRSRLPISHSVC